MLRAGPPNSHNQKIYEQRNGTKVAAVVLLLKNFPGMVMVMKRCPLSFSSHPVDLRLSQSVMV